MSEGMITALCFMGVLFFLLLLLLLHSARKTGDTLKKMFREEDDTAPNAFLEDWEAAQKAKEEKQKKEP